MKRLGFSLLVLVLLAGCGDSDFEAVSGQPSPTGSQAVIDQVRADLDDEVGGEIRTAGGHTLRIPASVLSQDTGVTLTQIDESPLQPADPDFRSVGDYLHVTLDRAQLQSEVEIEIPADPEDPQNSYVQLVVGSQVVPLESTLLPDGRTLIARFNPGRLEGVGGFESDNFLVGAGRDTDYKKRPDHQNWPSYNAYVFRDGSFKRFIYQGTKESTLEKVGNKPVVVVHGFGSDASTFNTFAQALLDSGFTSVIAFEYDTLSPAVDAGKHLLDFYNLLAGSVPEVTEWHHLAHSKGVLVSRKSFETLTARNYDSIKAVFIGGANQGSPVADALIAKSNFFDPGMQLLISNDLLDFKNADGTPCKININDPGFQDLASNSAIVGSLNQGDVASRHPKVEYRTVAGTEKGSFAVADSVLGINPEDGVIAKSSANADFIGATGSIEVPFDHVNMLSNSLVAIPKIIELLNKP